uniref:TMF_TATA_bd domain-containing protein n=1 Tax=Macrostomum lignano TaxID=282301 RepID=A0A1I8GAL5_9PLAT
ERLTEEARRELQELSEKHEAEKAEMFELVKQFGVSSFSTDKFRSNDAGTMTDSSAETLKLAERISLGSSGARAGQGAETSREAQSQPASIESFCFLVQLRKKASSMARELVEARSQLQQSSEYSENLQRCSHQVDAANCDLYKEIEGHKKQISAVSQVAEEIREKFISEARRVAKLETKLASLRQENSELQCRDATLRLAQVSDASEIASLNRRLDEAKRGLAQAAETADLANKKLEETRLEMEKLKAKYQSVKQELLKAQRGT